MSVTKRIPIAIGIKPNQEATFTNKTINCAPGNGNVISNIPNSSLVNSSFTINGQTISLGGQATVSIEGGETDPVFAASPSAGITSTNISNWNTAYGWGNHASAGYLTALPSRLTSTVNAPLTSSGLSVGVSTNVAKSYALLSITTSAQCWVTLYSDVESRTADSTRLQGVDPEAGSGVIAEVITTGPETVRFTPAPIGWNTANNNIVYARVVNTAENAAQISVTLQYIPLEG
jgi:hypothetical protein